MAALPLAGATRALSNFVTFKMHRKAELQHLRVGQARIGHVGLHHARAIKAAYLLALRIELPACARAA